MHYRNRRSLYSLSRDPVYDISAPWPIRLKPKDSLEVEVGTHIRRVQQMQLFLLAVVTPPYPQLSRSYL